MAPARSGAARVRPLRIAGHVVALAPGLLLLVLYLTGGLGPWPARQVVLWTGRIAIALLVASLAPTVLARLARWPAVLVLRREWGLYGFKYALVHLLAQVTLDYGGALGVWVADVLPKWYALMGMASLLLMVPLAITSAPGWVARLGVWWKRLHRLAYVAAGAAVVHYLWTVKSARTGPYLAAGALLVLLAARVVFALRPARDAMQGTQHESHE